MTKRSSINTYPSKVQSSFWQPLHGRRGCSYMDAYMSRILVIGGSGFIGEQLVKALRTEGKNVVAPRITELDIASEQSKLGELFQKHDTLIILTQPTEKGIKNIRSALALSEIDQVLYASTALVYGSSTKPQGEGAPVSPASDYARQKYAEEQLLRESGVPLTIMRFGNVYGGLKNRGIVQKAIETLYAQKPLETSGEDQIRDFIHVDDIVKAVCALVDLPPANRVVNIMTGKGTKIGDVFNMIEHLTGKHFTKLKSPEGEQVNVVGNIQTLQKLTGFTPQISLKEGLQKTIDIYDRSIQK